MTASISGQPEVAVKVSVEVNLELNDWNITSGEYCPIVFSVGADADHLTNYTFSPSTGTLEAFEQTVENAVIALLTGGTTVANTVDASTADVDYVPNTNLGKSVVVNWAWAFEVAGNNDEDTELGNLATAPTMSFTIGITVEQLN